ncbi:hypothetical protein GCM10017635_05230 [Paracoccus kondratievae]|uniref:Uncharacterized protein n=1 Tax=Paracoccus kondratievae TaxID=135740 RepID=A0AAD3NWG3_9RHOB|nr:hypothetical protein GCM10017635_05230 [Paracoccus kondratievae]
MDQDFRDHTTIRMLDNLPALFNFDLSGGDDGAGYTSPPGPKTKAADQNQHGDQPQDYRPAR